MRNSEFDPRRPSAATWSRITAFLGVDWPKRAHQPRPIEFVMASIVAISGSLIACIVVVTLTSRWFPLALKNSHMQFADYYVPIIVTVAIGCAAWPVVTWISSRGRRLFLCVGIAVVVLIVALDVWIFDANRPVATAAIMVAMHLGVALVTYLSLVFLAPQWPRREPRYFED
jgi:hypothetical protein